MADEVGRAFALYLAIVGTDEEGAAPRVLHRQPVVDHADTPFPAAVAAFALASAPPPAAHTAVLTLADGARLHVASLVVSERRALLLLSHRPLIASALAALRALRDALVSRLRAQLEREARSMQLMKDGARAQVQKLIVERQELQSRMQMLELGMRKAGAGAAGLADSPLARGPDDRETRFGTRSEWADFADFAKERKGKDHAYERAKAEKAMAEGGDGWRPGAHDEALDSLLDRFDDADDPIVMRELAPTPEVTFDVADMPEAPPDGRPMLFFGPPPGGRPLVGGRPGTSAAPRALSSKPAALGPCSAQLRTESVLCCRAGAASDAPASAGVNVGFGNFTVGGSYGHTEDDYGLNEDGQDLDAFDVGVSYAIDAASVSLSYGYEDFVEGLVPDTKDGNLVFVNKDGSLKKFLKLNNEKNQKINFYLKNLEDNSNTNNNQEIVHHALLRFDPFWDKLSVKDYHQEVIDSNGYVWWGKFGRKLGQQKVDSIMTNLSRNLDVFLYLFSEDKCYKAKLGFITNEINSVNKELIPSYYQEVANERCGTFFKITEIKEADYSYNLQNLKLLSKMLRK